MNTSIKTALILSFAATLQLAAVPSQAQGSLTVRCAALHLPTQQAVGQALGISNFSQTYSAREKLMRGINKACHAGAEQVTFTADPTDRAQSNGSPRVAAKPDYMRPSVGR